MGVSTQAPLRETVEDGSSDLLFSLKSTEKGRDQWTRTGHTMHNPKHGARVTKSPTLILLWLLTS